MADKEPYIYYVTFLLFFATRPPVISASTLPDPPPIDDVINDNPPQNKKILKIKKFTRFFLGNIDQNCTKLGIIFRSDTDPNFCRAFLCFNLI